MKNKKLLTICFSVVLMACNEDKIEILKPSLISGKLTYTDIRSQQKKDAPKGTTIAVAMMSGDKILKESTFQTTQDGWYGFTPSVEGTYRISASTSDSMLRFDSGLVEKEDLDTTRTKEFDKVTYSGTVNFKVDKDNKYHNEEITLGNESTSLKLTLKDEHDNPLRGMRVCIYDNEDFASENSPYCGGSIAYLSSDENGELLFTGLLAKAYFVNARGNIGSVSLDNQYDADARKTGVLMANKRNDVVITLK